MAQRLSDAQIETKLKTIENKIKNQNNVYRADIQMIINKIIDGVDSIVELEGQIKKLIVDRANIKKFGVKTFLTPRADIEEKDITLKFLPDLRSYLRVNERFFNG